jgi:hypothetical protein
VTGHEKCGCRADRFSMSSNFDELHKHQLVVHKDKMIIPGRAIIPNPVKGIRSVKQQTQPCDIDLMLKRVFEFGSACAVDFDNSLRKKVSYIEHPPGYFPGQNQTRSGSIGITKASANGISPRRIAAGAVRQ